MTLSNLSTPWFPERKTFFAWKCRLTSVQCSIQNINIGSISHQTVKAFTLPSLTNTHRRNVPIYSHDGRLCMLQKVLNLENQIAVGCCIPSDGFTVHILQLWHTQLSSKYKPGTGKDEIHCSPGKGHSICTKICHMPCSLIKMGKDFEGDQPVSPEEFMRLLQTLRWGFWQPSWHVWGRNNRNILSSQAKAQGNSPGMNHNILSHFLSTRHCKILTPLEAVWTHSGTPLKIENTE